MYLIAYGLTLIVCSVFGKEESVSFRKIFVEKKVKNDLDGSASGYIFRSDGDNPPVYIKLGSGGSISGGDRSDDNINQYAGPLKNAGSYSSSLPSNKPKYSPKAAYSKYDKSSSHSTYENDIIKEAFKHIPPLDKVKNNHDFAELKDKNDFSKFKDSDDFSDFKDIVNKLKFPPKNVRNFEKIQSIHIDEEDGYGIADIEEHSIPSVMTKPTYSSNTDNYDAPPETYNHKPNFYKTSKAYIAPKYEVPDSHEVTFNQNKAPVKYDLKAKRPNMNYYGQRTSTYNTPGQIKVTEENVDDDYDREYMHFKKSDHHYKPEKHKFAKGGGGHFKSDHHASHGKKGEKGYKKYHDFDEGEMGHHGKEGKKGFFEDEMAFKKKHHKEGEKHHEGHGGGHGEKGTKYGEKGDHKKGHKTSGYHNIFHKDEFKKEHKFYDDAHKQGYHDKHGGFHDNYGKKHAHKDSSGFHESDFDQGHKGNMGTYKKGHFDQDHKGHKGKSGHESHYDHHNEYGKKSDHDESKKYGFDHDH